MIQSPRIFLRSYQNFWVLRYSAFASSTAWHFPFAGHLDKAVTLNLPTYGCGLRLSSKNGRNGEVLMQYSVTLEIQQDRHLRQIADQEIQVSCQINSEEFSFNSQKIMNELEADLMDDTAKRFD